LTDYTQEEKKLTPKLYNIDWKLKNYECITHS